MGYKIDNKNENYRKYRLKKLASRMQCPGGMCNFYLVIVALLKSMGIT